MKKMTDFNEKMNESIKNVLETINKMNFINKMKSSDPHRIWWFSS